MCILSLTAIGDPILHPPLPLLILLASRQPRKLSSIEVRGRTDRVTVIIITPRCAGFRRCMSLSSADVTVKRTVKLKFHGTDTDTDTDTDFLADFRARILERKSAYRGARGPFSSPTRSADFCPTRAFPREDVRWGCVRVHVYVYCT